MKAFNRLLHNRIMMHFPDWRMHQPWDIFTRLDFSNLPFYWRKLMTLKFSDVIFPLNREASPFDNRLIWRRYEVDTAKTQTLPYFQLSEPDTF